MKLPEALLLATSAAFLLFGIHQAMTYGVQFGYFFFMVSSGLFLWYTLRKKRAEKEQDNKTKKPKTRVQKDKK